VNYPDGRFAVQFNGRSLPFRTFDKIRTVQPGAIVDNKRLSAVLTLVKARQAEYEPKRQRRHVARQRPPNNRKRKPMATYRIGCLAVRLFRPDVSGLMSMIG
jgi:hypothetical protein